MTLQMPSSSLAAIGRQSLILRLPPSSQRTIYSSTYLTIHQTQKTSQASVAVWQQRYRFSSCSRTQQKSSKPPANRRPLQRTTPAVSPSSPTPSGSIAIESGIPDFSDKINPPATTLPAPLDIPPKDPNVGKIRNLIRTGRAYWSFYKTGVKNVFKNARARRRLVRLVRSYQPAKEAPPPMPGTKVNPVLDQRALGLYDNYPLTRAEFQFFTRSWRDAKKIPIFVVLLAIFGEYLPLVVIFCTPLVPYPCRIPKQIAKSRAAAEERRSKSFRGEIGGAVPKPLGKDGEALRNVKELDAAQLRHVGRSLGLYLNVWDKLNVPWPSSPLLRFRVRKRVEYLQLDDALFRRDGGTSMLEGQEVILAAEERGIDVLNRKEGELRKLLAAWEKGAAEGRSLSMLLSRPSVWAEKKA